MQASRAQNCYVHNLPAPRLLVGIGGSKKKTETQSKKTQAYFNQGISFLHDFWDFDASRAFKEAIRNDSNVIMPYWGLLKIPGPDEDSVYRSNKDSAIKQLKSLVAIQTNMKNFMPK